MEYRFNVYLIDEHNKEKKFKSFDRKYVESGVEHTNNILSIEDEGNIEISRQVNNEWIHLVTFPIITGSVITSSQI